MKELNTVINEKSFKNIFIDDNIIDCIANKIKDHDPFKDDMKYIGKLLKEINEKTGYGDYKMYIQNTKEEVIVCIKTEDAQDFSSKNTFYTYFIKDVFKKILITCGKNPGSKSLDLYVKPNNEKLLISVSMNG